LEAVAEAAGDVADPARVLVVVGLEVAAVAGVVAGAAEVVPVVVATAVVVPLLGTVEVPAAVRQSVLELAWTVNAADWARLPVLSRRFRPREVPAVTLTVHVSELAVC